MTETVTLDCEARYFWRGMFETNSDGGRYRMQVHKGSTQDATQFKRHATMMPAGLHSLQDCVALLVRTCLLIITCPTAVLATCPVAADLDTGIWVEYQYRYFSEFIIKDNGIIVEIIHHADENPEVFELKDGIHVTKSYRLSGSEVDAATIKDYQYDLSKFDFPEPVKGGPYYIPVTIIQTVEESGSEFGKQSVAYTYGVEFGWDDHRTIGTCGSKTQEFAKLYDTDADDETVTYMDYLPELGIAVITGYGNEHEPWATSYDALSISTNKPE